MLSVDNIPAGTSIWLLNDGARPVQELLEQVPHQQKLWDHDIDLSSEGRLWHLWSLIRSSGWRDNNGGVGWTKTSKLLATKRPHAVPIYDSLIENALFGGRKPKNYWNIWRERLTGEQGIALRTLVDDVRKEAGVGNNLSLLRTIDIVVWMWEKDRLRARH